jgi:hypothetical protein
MKIVIQKTNFNYDLGCRVLKLKGGNSPFEQLNDIWGDIKPITFSEIATLKNIEQRRVAINYLGIDNLIEHINPKLLNTETIQKTTTWLDDEGKLKTFNFSDTYELYKVSRKNLLGEEWLNGNNQSFYYYVKCKDTSTNRDYLIWVDLHDIYLKKTGERWSFHEEEIDAIDAIAWTITTDVRENNVKKIVRQGDCIFIEPKDPDFPSGETRHLSKEEYLNLLVCES